MLKMKNISKIYRTDHIETHALRDFSLEVGLATFNVTTRARQIGTRRALGARKRDIVQHFMVENALVTGAGIIAGCVLALGAGYWLSLQYKLPRLDLYYLVAGVLLLWLVGQAAAWQPARRAAAVPPSVATRA